MSCFDIRIIANTVLTHGLSNARSPYSEQTIHAHQNLSLVVYVLSRCVVYVSVVRVPVRACAICRLPFALFCCCSELLLQLLSCAYACLDKRKLPSEAAGAQTMDETREGPTVRVVGAFSDDAMKTPEKRQRTGSEISDVEGNRQLLPVDAGVYTVCIALLTRLFATLLSDGLIDQLIKTVTAELDARKLSASWQEDPAFHVNMKAVLGDSFKESKSGVDVTLSMLPQSRSRRNKVDLRHIDLTDFDFPSGLDHSAAINQLKNHIAIDLKSVVKRPACLVGPSGCGKTKALFELAHFRYAVFFDFSQRAGKSGFDPVIGDSTVRRLVQDIGVIWKRKLFEVTGKELYERHSKDSEHRVAIDFCARWLLLVHLADKSSVDVHPGGFLDSQLGPGRAFITSMVEAIKQQMLTFDALKLHSTILKRVRAMPKLSQGSTVTEGLAIIDEAAVARRCLAEVVVSRSMLENAGRDVTKLLSGEGTVLHEAQRGVLSLCIAAASDLDYSHATASTTSLPAANIWSSSLGKIGIIASPKDITQFDHFPFEDVRYFLSKLVNLDKANLDTAARALTGRLRWAEHYVHHVVDKLKKRVFSSRSRSGHRKWTPLDKVSSKACAGS